MVCYGMVWKVMVCYGMVWKVMVCYSNIETHMDTTTSKYHQLIPISLSHKFVARFVMVVGHSCNMSDVAAILYFKTINLNYISGQFIILKTCTIKPQSSIAHNVLEKHEN